MYNKSGARDSLNDDYGMNGPEKTLWHWPIRGQLHFIFLLVILMTLSPSITAQPLDASLPTHFLTTRAPNASFPLLECFQVSPPILSPTTQCQQTLMIHTFGLSYGQPFVGNYTPPHCQFNRVTFNFTVTSAGRQYDRLALMFFNDTEIFRTSTAEPTQNGIIWTYMKDMSNYLSLFREPQKIIFDLGNIVNDVYTGSWNTTLTATFFQADDVDAADLIIPLSTRKSDQDSPSAFVVPESKALDTFKIPRNVKKAYFTISACGQAEEEFWWSNALSSDTKFFGNETTLLGHSPFRELQLLIDGSLAGVAWPFPVIFTGGIVPGFWRPVVGIDAFDLKEDEIDITPFLPVLSDGNEHTIEIRVLGIDDDGKGHGILAPVGSNWVVTGKLFAWLDHEGHVTTGTAPTIDAPEPSLNLHSTNDRSKNGSVDSLKYSVSVNRGLSISSTITTSAGPQVITWKQTLNYTNEGEFTNNGNDQSTRQATSGTDISSSGYSKQFEYPLYVLSSYRALSGGNVTIDGTMTRGKDVRKIGALAFTSDLGTFTEPGLGSLYKGTSSGDFQNGTAHYENVPALKKSFGSGSTEQYYFLYGISDSTTPNETTELYRHHVLAVNDSIILNEENIRGDGQRTQNIAQLGGMGEQEFALQELKSVLGRGPS